MRPSSRACSVFVGNVPYDVDEEMLKVIFATVGPIVSLRLMYDKVTRQPKGYGFCEYRDQETAYAAMRNLNNVECGGRPLRVDWADHELKATEGVMRQPGRATTAEVVMKHARVRDPRLQEMIDRITTSESAEELSADAIIHCEISALVNQMSCSQMVNSLGHAIRIISENPEGGKAMLVAHPHLALALMHMSFLLGLSSDPALPMSMNDIRFATERINQLKNSKIAPQKPCILTSLVTPAIAALPPHLMMPAGPPPKLPTAPPVGTVPPKPALQPSTLTAEQKRALIDQLALLTPEQVANLPEEVKRQVLEIMSSSSV